MKTTFLSKLLACVALAGFISITGCDDGGTSDAKTAMSDDHDHDHDHEGHDHDHDHDHEGHDHDHEGHDHDHEGHDHGEGDHSHDFETIGAAAKEIGELRDKIRDGFADGDTDAAHGPLHHVGEVLEAAETLIGKLELTEEQKKSATEAVETLFDSFGAVDEGLHDKEGKSYDEVSKAIDAAIETLQNIEG